MSSPKIKLEYFQHFLSQRKKYLKNNPRRFAEYKKVIVFFLSNPAHQGVYTIRLNSSDRIFFVWKEKHTAVFIDIGKHDKYRKY